MNPITIAPEHEAPDNQLDFAKTYSRDTNWLFVT